MKMVHFWQRTLSVFATVALCALAASASAQTVLIDFGNDESFRGLSVDGPDDNGNYWNSLRTGVFYQDLVDIDNAATTIDFGFSTPVGTDSYNGPAGATDASFLESDVQLTEIDQEALGNLGGSFRAAFDYVASPIPPAPGTGFKVRFEIQGLDPLRTYDLTFFSSHKYEGDTATRFTVYSSNTYATSIGTVDLNVRNPAPGSEDEHNQDMVATLANLAPQESNILYVEFVGASGGVGYLNDMQIVANAPSFSPGDFNQDGSVDAADYVLWRKTPTSYGGPDGYNTWKQYFGTGGTGAGGSGAVPEPTSLIGIVLAAFGLAATYRRR